MVQAMLFGPIDDGADNTKANIDVRVSNGSKEAVERHRPHHNVSREDQQQNWQEHAHALQDAFYAAFR